MKNQFFFFLFLLFNVSYSPFPLDAQENQGIQFYNTGLSAKTFEDQQTAFNQALYFFEDELQKESSSPFLFHQIGNCYFQLNEYAWAILYYQRSLQLNPENTEVIENLGLAREILSLPSSSSFFKDNQFFAFLFSPTQRLRLLFWLSCLTLIGFCFSFIFTSSLSKKILVIFSFSTALVWLICFFAYFLTPTEGILVQASKLYSAPSFDQPQLLNPPLLAGRQVRILQATETGEWVKIQTPEKTIGYLPFSVIRSI